MEWLEGLGVEMERSDASLSVSTKLSGGGRQCEWSSGNGLTFWRMIPEIRRFNHDALRYLDDDHEEGRDETSLGQFIQTHGYSQLFQEAYLIPMCACIWSCPSQQEVLGFSAFIVLSFCRDNHLLQVRQHAFFIH
jgi:cyclopropane-fatty-acyl-phospholipid synthase